MQYSKAIKYKHEVHNLYEIPRKCFPSSLIINIHVPVKYI